MMPVHWLYVNGTLWRRERLRDLWAFPCLRHWGWELCMRRMPRTGNSASLGLPFFQRLRAGILICWFFSFTLKWATNVDPRNQVKRVNCAHLVPRTNNCWVTMKIGRPFSFRGPVLVSPVSNRLWISAVFAHFCSADGGLKWSLQTNCTGDGKQSPLSRLYWHSDEPLSPFTLG